jgi:hypothetical protein
MYIFLTKYGVDTSNDKINLALNSTVSDKVFHSVRKKVPKIARAKLWLPTNYWSICLSRIFNRYYPKYDELLKDM